MDWGEKGVEWRGENVVFSRKPEVIRLNPLAFFTLREKKVSPAKTSTVAEGGTF